MDGCIKPQEKELFPYDLWVSDVSFLKFQGRFWYLVTIEEIVNRRIIGAHVGKKHDRYLVLTAVKEVLIQTKEAPSIFHSDQGTEFMAEEVTSFLKNLGTQISASDKASSWQNGYQESFFGRFKDEIGDINRFDTIGELIEEIYLHIHYYNTQRIYTALEMPPAVYANALRALSEKMGT